MLARLVARHHHQVFQRRHLGEFMRDLEGAQHADGKQFMGLEARDILALEYHLTAIGGDIAGHDVEQRGFTGAIGPDQPRNRSAPNRKGNAC
jgi:hypothetical protein